jgi:Protein of unknown function (DUF3040)
MPVGAGGEALRRIEAALAADDPALVESFRRWREPPGTDPGDLGFARVGGWTGLVPLLGLATLAVGPLGTLVLLLAGVVLLTIRRSRKADFR